MFKRILKFIKDVLPSRETVIRTFKRAGSSALVSAATAFLLVPMNFEDPKKYLVSLVVGVGSGFLQGLIKFISGYVKYDLN